MSRKVTGIATIRVDGVEFPTERGATLDPGGVTRTPKMAGRRVFYNEEPVPPMMESTVLHTEDIDLLDIGRINNATVLFECDNGQDYILTGAFTVATGTLNSGEGTIPLNMSATNCERL